MVSSVPVQGKIESISADALRSGMNVVTRNGRQWVVMRDFVQLNRFYTYDIVLIGADGRGFTLLDDNYDEELRYTDDSDWDIIEVWMATNPVRTLDPSLQNKTLLWSREEETQKKAYRDQIRELAAEKERIQKEIEILRSKL